LITAPATPTALDRYHEKRTRRLMTGARVTLGGNAREFYRDLGHTRGICIPRMTDTSAKETCAHCGQELWHAPGGWKHLFTSRERCDGGGQADSAGVATPKRRLYR
jgi:hypothetical protein